MTTDTRAALDAALDAYASAREYMERGGYDPADQSSCDAARANLDTAIAAHVEAEVARRLAAAPEVDEAIGDFDDACSSLMRQRYEDTPADAREPANWDESLLELYHERKADLLAAIAADKARAVAATKDSMRRVFRCYTPAVSVEAATQGIRLNPRS